MEKQQLPNSTLILVFGIISIVLCWCYGIIGIPLAIVALVLAGKAKKTYLENPEQYSGYQNMKAGKILAIIGLILNILFLCYIVWIFSQIGWEVFGDPELMMERLEEMKANG
ncbi:CCC motif membrane protein [Psychroserpens sp. SPM9]|uniref:CCC motif membrane protein n=1 Tax=Psychroserpens sp. SPM9 TaxID=2975598 RepID=UPI0021A43C69|nr:CCC motif membrane protein [Psychroserpens sp. SPM9]MDG5491402.1 CCC motif membrane protein [Psychroserpens sp. SPM9]